MQIAKDIYLAAGGAYGENSNVYIVDTGEGLVLIDCGYDRKQIGTIMEVLSYWGLAELPITHALITHSHFDHTGNARYFEQLGVTLIASPQDGEAIMKGDERTIGYAFMGRKFEACSHVEAIRDGEIFRKGKLELEAVAVPGHTEGSMLYRMKKDGKYILFAGDFLIIKGNCEDAELGWDGGVDYDRNSYLESIRHAKDMETDILLPGHGLPCLKNGYAMLQMLYKEALTHLR